MQSVHSLRQHWLCRKSQRLQERKEVRRIAVGGRDGSSLPELQAEAVTAKHGRKTNIDVRVRRGFGLHGNAESPMAITRFLRDRLLPRGVEDNPSLPASTRVLVPSRVFQMRTVAANPSFVGTRDLPCSGRARCVCARAPNPMWQSCSLVALSSTCGRTRRYSRGRQERDDGVPGRVCRSHRRAVDSGGAHGETAVFETSVS